MSPIRIKSSGTVGQIYESPFLGPVDHTVAVKVNLANLTNKEIDSEGYVKPGVPLTRAGALVGAQAASTTAAAVAGGGNTGNGTVTGVSAGVNAPTQTVTLTCTVAAANGGTFSVIGSVSGNLGNATVGTPFVSDVINLTINDGATDFVVGDTFTIAVTESAADEVFGVTVEEVKVADDNAAATLSALGSVDLAVAFRGAVLRKIAEDQLGRVFTAAEVAGFKAPGCGLTLITPDS